MKCSLFVPLIAVVLAYVNHARAVEVASPDAQLVVTVNVVDGSPTYSARWLGEPLVDPSTAGAKFVISFLKPLHTRKKHGQETPSTQNGSQSPR